MMISWVLSFILLAEPVPKADLWVYVDDLPNDKTQHVLDGLQTPLESIYERHPTIPTRKYVCDIHKARRSLAARCNVHIVTRDKAQIASYVELPAWSFSPREIPQPFHEDCYLLMYLIPEHLDYIAKIRAFSISQPRWRVRTILGVKIPTGEEWFHTNLTEKEYDGNYNGNPCRIKERIQWTRLRFEPSPAIKLNLPRTIIRTYTFHDEISSTNVVETVKTYCEEANLRFILQQADMNTGFILNTNEDPLTPNAPTGNENDDPRN
jgi:hypothetical protein